MRHSSFSSPSVSPSFSLLRDPARPTGGHRRISRAPSVQEACARVRAAVGSPRSLPFPLLYNLAGSEEAPPESEGGELGGGSSRVVEASDWEKSQSALVGFFPLPVSLTHLLRLPRPRSFSRPGPLRVSLRVSARRGRPGGALALRVRADGRRAGCGAWCPRSWAACPAR